MRSAQIVHLFHWDEEAAIPLVQKLEAAGYAVNLHTKGGGLSVREMQKAAAVVIDLSRLPSHGRAVAAWLRGSKSTRGIPIVFVDGEAEKIARVKQDVPDAVYASSKDILGALKKAVANAPARPVIPPQMMASIRPNAEKLGIRLHSRVLVLDAPPNVEKVLGPLPDGVTFTEEGAAPVTLWFVYDVPEFERALPSRRNLAASSRLWIIWRKGQSNGLNGNRVRAAALELGLVDYKICSLDGIWSGMAFAVRK